MSWPQWPRGTAPQPQLIAPVINPASTIVNPATAVNPAPLAAAGVQYTPEQWAQMQQQNWQQWAHWQQQFQQWQQQYRAQYAKSLSTLATPATSTQPAYPNTAVPLPLPAEAKPPLPPDDPPPGGSVTAGSQATPNTYSGYSSAPSSQPSGYSTASSMPSSSELQQTPQRNERPAATYGGYETSRNRSSSDLWQNQSTNRAQRCLTSVIGREPVQSVGNDVFQTFCPQYVPHQRFPLVRPQEIV